LLEWAVFSNFMVDNQIVMIKYPFPRQLQIAELLNRTHVLFNDLQHMY